jgi:hypothetical protein
MLAAGLSSAISRTGYSSSTLHCVSHCRGLRPRRGTSLRVAAATGKPSGCALPVPARAVTRCQQQRPARGRPDASACRGEGWVRRGRPATVSSADRARSAPRPASFRRWVCGSRLRGSIFGDGSRGSDWRRPGLPSRRGHSCPGCRAPCMPRGASSRPLTHDGARDRRPPQTGATVRTMLAECIARRRRNMAVKLLLRVLAEMARSLLCPSSWKISSRSHNTRGADRWYVAIS